MDIVSCSTYPTISPNRLAQYCRLDSRTQAPSAMVYKAFLPQDSNRANSIHGYILPAAYTTVFPPYSALLYLASNVLACITEICFCIGYPWIWFTRTDILWDKFLVSLTFIATSTQLQLLTPMRKKGSKEWLRSQRLRLPPLHKLHHALPLPSQLPQN